MSDDSDFLDKSFDEASMSNVSARRTELMGKHEPSSARNILQDG